MKSAQEMLTFLFAVSWTKADVAKALATTTTVVRHWSQGEQKPRREAYKKLWKLYQQVKKEFQNEGED